MCNYASLEKQHFEAMYKAALKETNVHSQITVTHIERKEVPLGNHKTDN